MVPRKPYEESYELSEDISHVDDDFILHSFEDDNPQAHLLSDPQSAYPTRLSFIQKLYRVVFLRRRRKQGRSSNVGFCYGLLWPSSFRRLLFTSVVFLAALTVVTGLLFPSYTHPPLRYAALRNLAERSSASGGGNPRNEKVFIAASIFDKTGDLAGGAWGSALLKLIELLGPENTYLSVYENDAGSIAQQALESLERKVQCSHSLIFDEHLGLDDIPSIVLPDGTTRIKRIEYLSEVRNRALRPLQSSATRFDKVLYLNDVVFDPIEAIQLLFATNADDDGRAEYRAACSVDFINPFKYYDTFATRDIQGYSIGLPFFPFFTTAGDAKTRKQVLAGHDNVRVRSCWGGMVAFDARYLQPQSNSANIPLTAASESPSNITAPYHFRAEQDLYWDASECCLIHADIQDPDPEYSGIFLNPYIRVAYDSRTLSWLKFTRRFEKLYSPIHWIVSRVVGMPWYNPRRNEKPYDKVAEKVWISEPGSPSGGSFQMLDREATHSGFCGRQALQVLKSDITKGGKNWEFLPVPS